MEIPNRLACPFRALKEEFREVLSQELSIWSGHPGPMKSHEKSIQEQSRLTNLKSFISMTSCINPNERTPCSKAHKESSI